MIFGSLCSGIEAASVAWHPLGWRPAFFSEIAKFPSAVLAHHYPNVPNHGDMRAFESWPDADIDVLCGGTPCQSFSVAGLREGIRDPRGALTRTFLEVAARYRPRWILWENVPGVRSSDYGRALGAFLAGLGELGYGYAWASLDAQHFGLAQRRERVFVVASARGWQRAAAVLFDAACMRGDPAPRRETREGVTGTLSASSARRSADEGDRDTLIAGTLGANHSNVRADQAWTGRLVAGTLGTTSHDWSRDNIGESIIAHSLRASGFDASEDGTGRGTPLVPVTYDLQQITSRECRSNPQPGDPCGTLANPARVALAFQSKASASQSMNPSDVFPALDKSKTEGLSVHGSFGVRRLTPRECERLQGFPDDYTLIPYRGKPAADGPRYAALGNSWAVPVVRWIGDRIQMVDDAIALHEAAA